MYREFIFSTIDVIFQKTFKDWKMTYVFYIIKLITFKLLLIS